MSSRVEPTSIITRRARLVRESLYNLAGDAKPPAQRSAAHECDCLAPALPLEAKPWREAVGDAPDDAFDITALR